MIPELHAEPLDRGRITFPLALPGDGEEPSPGPVKLPDLKRKYTKTQLRNGAGRLLPSERVAVCGRHVSHALEGDGGAYVGLKRSEENIFWSGVITCGSVWHCADCAPRIATERQKEIAAIVERHDDLRGAVGMVTLTLPHNLRSDVTALRKDVAALWSKVIAGRAWKQAVKAWSVVGGVRSLEVTHGGNGWHPHLHVLVFVDAPLQYGDIGTLTRDGALGFMRWLVHRWVTLAGAAGFAARHAAQDYQLADDAATAAEYVTKWGLDWEVTHAHLKKSGRGGRSPFQILTDWIANDRSQDGALFREYALAFKGARQLTWFGDLRARYSVPERSDAELIEDQEREAETVAYLSKWTFEQVQARGAELCLFRMVASHGYEGVLMALSFVGIPLAGVRPARGGSDLWRRRRRRPGGSVSDICETLEW